MVSKTPKKCCWSLDVEAPKSAADSANTLENSHMRAVRPESGLTRVSAKELKVGKKLKGEKSLVLLFRKYYFQVKHIHSGNSISNP